MRITESQLRKIIREETRKLNEAPATGEWVHTDGPPYVHANSGNAELDEAFADFGDALERLSVFATTKLIDDHHKAPGLAVRYMALSLLNRVFFPM